ncbi:exosortase system-associated protein, TIGR04073 family [Methylomonas sp. LL1]|uniref:exosortase system-associated protein, TIGR04073 family n=1 Tax=Methylomonas sp. LL1 TaxID=2785785 RepID=UPI0018C3BCCC|nr:exosortase system-associated protein, TIGR04073 family [Methylomonas sp. LL1]QPK62005.1 exosortase system-associated protein, TIGR04073 family [Methylomonas sp. LL1]
MKHTTPTLACMLLVGSFAVMSPVQADVPAESYGEIVGRKLLSGLGNMTTAVAEVPKNIIIVNNESNFAYAFSGGLLKGILHTVGRMGVGIADLITAPIPTYPIVHPGFVWEDFYSETTYGPAMVGQSTNH